MERTPFPPKEWPTRVLGKMRRLRTSDAAVSTDEGPSRLSNVADGLSP